MEKTILDISGSVFYVCSMDPTPSSPPTRTLSERFATIIQGILHDVTLRGPKGPMWVPLLSLLGSRLGALQKRFFKIALMLRDGTLPAVGPAVGPAVAPARVRPELFGPPAPRPVPAVVLPRRFGWIQRMMPEWQAHWINHWRLQLEEFLADPELLAMLAAAPQTRRVLRPICPMVAIKPPAALALPKRTGVRRPRVKKLETDEQADRRVARMSDRAFANMLTPETDNRGWRFPNRIGYGRARRVRRPD